MSLNTEKVNLQENGFTYKENIIMYSDINNFHKAQQQNLLAFYLNK